MSTFDDRLADRINRLDAAIPAPSPVKAPAVRRRMAWRGRRAVLFAAALAIGGTTAVAADRLLFPDLPEPKLEAVIEAVFDDRECRSLEVAEPEVRLAMDAAGYVDWTIARDQGAGRSRCVGAAVIPPLHEVRMIPTSSWEVAEAMEWLSEELRTNCLTRAEAMQLTTSLLESRGESNFDIRADPWGPQAVPLDKPGGPEAYIEHAKHCYVYSGSGRENGRLLIFLWGPWP